MRSNSPSTDKIINERLGRYLMDISALAAAAVVSLISLIGVVWGALLGGPSLPLAVAIIVLLCSLGVALVGVMSRQRARVGFDGVVLPWKFLSRLKTPDLVMWKDVKEIRLKSEGKGWRMLICLDRTGAKYDLVSYDLENPDAAERIIKDRVQEVS